MRSRLRQILSQLRKQFNASDRTLSKSLWAEALDESYLNRPWHDQAKTIDALKVISEPNALGFYQALGGRPAIAQSIMAVATGGHVSFSD